MRGVNKIEIRHQAHCCKKLQLYMEKEPFRNYSLVFAGVVPHNINFVAQLFQPEAAYQVTDAAEGSSSMTDEGPSTPVAREIHELPVSVVDEKDPDSVICSTSASDPPQPSESVS